MLILNSPGIWVLHWWISAIYRPSLRKTQNTGECKTCENTTDWIEVEKIPLIFQSCKIDASSRQPWQKLFWHDLLALRCKKGLQRDRKNSDATAVSSDKAVCALRGRREIKGQLRFVEGVQIVQPPLSSSKMHWQIDLIQEERSVMATIQSLSMRFRDKCSTSRLLRALYFQHFFLVLWIGLIQSDDSISFRVLQNYVWQVGGQERVSGDEHNRRRFWGILQSGSRRPCCRNLGLQDSMI